MGRRRRRRTRRSHQGNKEKSELGKENYGLQSRQLEHRPSADSVPSRFPTTSIMSEEAQEPGTGAAGFSPPALESAHSIEDDDTYSQNREQEPHFDTSEFFKDDPPAITHNLLCLALKNRAPLQVLRFMLRLNPAAATIPQNGQTALQVAVRHGASLDVIEEVIRANPRALFASNGTYDPLTYARIWRKEDKALIEMLAKPITTWTSTTTYGDIEKVPRREKDISMQNGFTTSTVNVPRDEHEELENIKRIITFIIKSQRHQSTKIKQAKKKIEDEMRSMEQNEATARHHQLETLLDHVAAFLSVSLRKQEEQTKGLLGVQDEASKAWVEARLTVATDDIISSTETITSFCQARLTEISNRLERETELNALFRKETSARLRSLEKRMEMTMNAQVSLQRRRKSRNVKGGERRKGSQRNKVSRHRKVLEKSPGNTITTTKSVFRFLPRQERPRTMNSTSEKIGFVKLKNQS